MEQERARRRLLPFILETCPEYQAGWFHERVCEKLEQFYRDVEAKKSPRLMLFAPPRHGKSEIVSRRFPAWALGRNPDLDIIATSYGADLASTMNRDVQRIIDSHEYEALFPGTRLNKGNIRTVAQEGSFLRNNDIFEIVGHKGVYKSAGVGGGITGRGARILLIDDPIKDAEQAGSEVYRQKVWDWFTSTAYTRLAPGGGVLIILTRWHEDDLAGRLIAQMAAEDKDSPLARDKWDIVSYPAVAEDDEADRKKGEPLHAERYPLDQLQRIKTVVGSRVWAALYQQHPAPQEGEKFKRDWWRFWRNDATPPVQKRPDGCSQAAARIVPDYFDEVIESWDLTFKGTQKSDWVVGVKVGRKGADKYILGLIRIKAGVGGARNGIAELRNRRSNPQCYETLIEEAANGAAVIEDLSGFIAGIIAVKPMGGKEARAAVLEPQVEAGNWFLPDGAHWLGDFVEEFAVFPNGKHDDQVDAVSQAAPRLSLGSDVAIALAMCSR